MYSLQFIV